MGRTVSADDKLEKRYESADLEDEQEETLSLSDLPLHLNKEESRSAEAEIEEMETRQEDFDFELWGGSLSSRSEMCSADDIFFQGQILPLRNSDCSENGYSNRRERNSNPISGCLSRSESIGAFTNFSSRSSSSRSQFSSSSSAASSKISRPRIQDQFFARSSPKPQIKIPNSRTGNASSNKNPKSTVWEFFRFGLFHNPEIELKDLKVRNYGSRNCSTSSNSKSNCSIRISSKKQSNNKQRKQSLIEKRLLLSGCNCTVNSVKPVPYTKLKKEEIEENKKKQGLKKTKKKKKNQKKKMVKMKEEGGGKKEMSTHRTVEWLKELSNPSFLEEEEEEEEGHSLGS